MLRKAMLCVMGAALSAQAQVTSADFAAFTGMMLTPVGALPMIQLSQGADSAMAKSVALRVAGWRFDKGDPYNVTYGATMTGPIGGKGAIGGTLAFYQPGESGSKGTLMGSMDYQMQAWKSIRTMDNPSYITIAARGDLGYGRFLGEEGSNFYSLVASAPIRIHYELASKADLLFLLAPGFGVAGYSEPGDSQFGTRALLALGGAWNSQGGVGIHAGAQQVMIQRAPWVWSAGVSIPVGRR